MEGTITIKNRCLIIIDYWASLSDKKRDFFDDARKTITSAFEKEDIEVLKKCAKSLNAWANSLSSDSQQKLNEIIEEKLCISIPLKEK